nr:MAG TPA: Protein of unknown function (DUF1492) [Caudoviricetes sp.]
MMIDLRRMRYLMDRLPMARLNVERAMSRATKCTQRLTMAAGGGGYGDAMSENAIRLSVAREKRDGILRELRELREALAPRIAELDDPVQRLIMQMRYLDGQSARQIAYALALSERWVFYNLSRAEARINAETKQEPRE